MDSLTINRGLGWQLNVWADFILNHSDATCRYKEFKRKIYLEPEEILEIINKNNGENIL